MDLAATIPLGLGAAASFAVSSVLQQRAARAEPESESLSWQLIAHLLRRPLWAAGMGFVVVAFGLQAAALAFGPVADVEPLIAAELVFALPLAARIRRRRLGPREWAAAGAVAGGVAGFLWAAGPSGGNPEPALLTWAEAALPCAAAAVLAVVAARGPESPRRAVLLATAAGVLFGLLALVTQSFVVLIGTGTRAAFSSWQPYVLVTLGVVGFTVAQSAYQSAPLAVSLPILDSLEPVVAVVLASVAFGQKVDLAPGHLALEATGAVLAITGIVTLARSPLVLSVYEQQQAAKDGAQPTQREAAPNMA